MIRKSRRSPPVCLFSASSVTSSFVSSKYSEIEVDLIVMQRSCDEGGEGWSWSWS